MVALIHNKAMIDKTSDKQKRNNMALAKKIASAIDASPMSAAKIAKKCGVTPQAISGWKSTGRIAKDMLAVFADVVEIPLNHFMPPAKSKDGRLRLVDVPANRDLLSGREVINLVALYWQSTDDGRRRIMDIATLVPKVAVVDVTADN
jgi:transcriptional regulator with XRE-family HTH domain